MILCDSCPTVRFLDWDLATRNAGCYRDGQMRAAGNGTKRRRWMMPITITITSGMLLAFFWAFWIFAFAGWWCGGSC